MEELTMSVSPICVKDGEKYAFVQFMDNQNKDRMAEGKIPACTVVYHKGFSEEECKALEQYMKEHLKELKKMAAGNNVFEALRK